VVARHGLWLGVLTFDLMKRYLIVMSFLFSNLALYAQHVEISQARFVAGLSGPELLHAGFTYRIANASQIGVNAGAGPSWGGLWPSVSLEHRLYIGGNAAKTGLRMWFIRQGVTYFPSESPPRHFTLNLTVGRDISFRRAKNGITVDAGMFYLPESESSSLVLVSPLNLWPALRAEFYFSL